MKAVVVVAVAKTPAAKMEDRMVSAGGTERPQEGAATISLVMYYEGVEASGYEREQMEEGVKPYIRRSGTKAPFHNLQFTGDVMRVIVARDEESKLYNGHCHSSGHGKVLVLISQPH